MRRALAGGIASLLEALISRIGAVIVLLILGVSLIGEGLQRGEN